MTANHSTAMMLDLIREAYPRKVSVTPVQAAAALGMAPNTIVKWIDQGVLPAIAVPGPTGRTTRRVLTRHPGPQAATDDTEAA